MPPEKMLDADLTEEQLRACVSPRELATLDALRDGTPMPAGLGIRRLPDLENMKTEGDA